MVGDSTIVAGPYSARTYPRIVRGPVGPTYLLYAAPVSGGMTAGVATFDGDPRDELAGSDLATDFRSPLLAVSPGGAPLAAWFTRSGRFVVAERTPDGWVEDSSLAEVTRCTYCRQWLASYPATGGPRVAYLFPDASAYRVRLASRGAGTWSVSEVDEAPVGAYALALAVDPAGRPWVAYEGSHYDSLFVAHRDRPGPWFAEPRPNARDPALREGAGSLVEANGRPAAPGSRGPRAPPSASMPRGAASLVRWRLLETVHRRASCPLRCDLGQVQDLVVQVVARTPSHLPMFPWARGCRFRPAGARGEP
jgi:hypothetical protein